MSLPYWCLSSFYFFYFAALGTLVPYWGLYLQSLHFDAVAIGSLMSILMATKILAPNVWGWLGDSLGKRMLIVRWASLVSLLAFSGMFMVQGFWGIALVMVLYSFFWNASLPQFEAVTFNYLGAQAKRYGRLRLWGSVGFIVTVLWVGHWIDAYGAGVVLWVLPVVFGGILFSSLLVHDYPSVQVSAAQPRLALILRQPTVLAFLAAVFLMQMSHGPYYAFFSIYLQDLGYAKSTIGWLWSVGVMAEVSLFLVMHRILHRWNAVQILTASLLFAALRWLLIGFFADELFVLLLAQLLHSASFGSFHASAIHLVHQYFKGQNQGRGQALYSSMSFGAGGAAGTFISGFIWQHGSPALAYTVAASVALIGALLFHVTLQRHPTTNEQETE